MNELVQRVHEQTKAYNQKDLAKLLANLAEDYTSYEVRPEGPRLRAQGREQVEQALTGMFAASGYASSRVEDVRAYGNLVVAVEIDSFETDDGTKTTRSLGLYEFADGKLCRSWSFPILEQA